MHNLKNNLLGGITSGVVALPLALAFGIASGLGVVAGIYGAIILGFFAAAFGGTKTQISGPTGPMTVVIAGIIALFPNNPQSIVFIIVVAGILQIIFGVIKVGKFVNFIPYPVISGFMSGIGVIIIILQLNPAIGSNLSGGVLEILTNLDKSFLQFNPNSLILTLLTLTVIYLIPKKLSSLIPPALIALILVTTISIFLGFQTPTIGEIPAAFPSITIPNFSFEDLRVLIPYAFTLAILGSIDSLLTSVVADSLTKTKHNSSKELIGQGIGNALCGLFGALPGAGATMRTVINIKSGSTNQLSGMTHSIALLIFVAGGSFLVEQIPLAVLAGILIKVGLDILDYRFLKNLTFAPKHDLYVMLTVLFLTIFVDLIVAVGVGLVLASLLLVKRMSDKLKVEVESIKCNKSDIPNNEDLSSDIMILHIDGAFFFGTINQIISRIGSKMDIKVLLFDCTKVPFMDLSAVFALEEAIKEIYASDIKVVMALKGEIAKKRFDKLGLTKLIGEDNIFLNLPDSITRAERLLN